MSKSPKQSGTQTTTTQMTLPSWLDSGFQNAAIGAGALYNSGGSPAVAQAQQAYNQAQNRYNSMSQMTPDGWRRDDTDGRLFKNEGVDGTRRFMDPDLQGMYNGNQGTVDSSEVDRARAALAAAQAQPWDETQDPLYRNYSDATQAGMDSILNAAGSGVSNNAMNLYNNTLNGDYLYGGDAFNAAYDAASNRITPQVTGAFNAAGRMGGGAGADELGGRLGDAFAGLYNNERQRQMGALSMAPAMDALAYEPGRRQLQVGMMQDDTNYANANIPGQRLDQYLARLSGMAPNFRGQTSEQPIYKQGGGIGSILGPALSLAGMASGNPWLGMAASGGGLLGMGQTGSMNMGNIGGGFDGFSSGLGSMLGGA